MPSTKQFLDYVLEQAQPVCVSYKKMMGEYLLYCHGVLFGGIYDNRLLLKPTKKAKELLPAAVFALPYPGAKPMLCYDLSEGESFSAFLEKLTE